MNNKTVQKFGQNMKKMSQGDICCATKIERADINQFRIRKAKPTLETIAKALEIEIGDL